MRLLKYIPNCITFIRIVLVCPFIYYLLVGNYPIVFYIFIGAGFSDGLDGFLARRFNWRTQIGAFADPLADKLLLLASFISLSYLGKLSPWVTGLVIVRDAVIMAGIGGLFYLHEKVRFDPTLISKWNTVFQGLLIFALLFELAYWDLPAIVIQGLILVVVFTTLWTLADYVWVWGRKTYFHHRHG